MRDLSNPRRWMDPRPFGEPHYDTQEEADLAQARRQVKHFAGYVRRSLRGIRLTRDIVLLGGYDYLTPAAIDQMFADKHAVLNDWRDRRRTCFAEQLKLERQQPAHDMAAE